MEEDLICAVLFALFVFGLLGWMIFAPSHMKELENEMNGKIAK